MPSPPAIFTLPPELIQHIIIASAFGAPPSTVATITETCKFFYSLVYNPTDHHLWREIFLAVFDDPRPALKHLTALFGEQPAFDWEEEFKARMRAAQVVHRSNRGPRPVNFVAQRPEIESMTSQTSLKRSPQIQITLHTLLSILKTSLPFPPTTTIAFGPLPSPGPGLPPKYPAFPPLILLLSSSFWNASNKSQYLRVFESTSSQWLEDILKDGFPPILTWRLLADPSLLEVRHGDDDAMEWAKSEEARLFYKLVAHTGFIPVSPPAQYTEASQKGAVGDNDLSHGPASDEEDTFFTPNTSPSGSDNSLPQIIPPLSPRTPWKNTSADAQFASARRMARRTVYDLRFLKPERMFGPFMPFMPSSPDKKANGQEGSSRKTRGSQVNDDHESDDPDYVYAGTDSDSNEGNDTESSENEEDDLINLTPQHLDVTPAERRQPSSHILMPDWAWLAGARIIVEANLRDMLRRTPIVNTGPDGAESGMDEVANALRKLEGLRLGGAPGFWDDGWMVGGRTPGNVDGNTDAKGKGKAKGPCEYEQGGEQGWDWAGASGTWRRCICWLDYRDLLINNLQFGINRFNDDTLQEALRIFPMTLRVSKCSWPPASAFSSNSRSSHCSSTSQLPIIHVEGEMAGLDQEITRYLKGTVNMIGDGAVRWSLQISSRSDGSPGEWSTEGVQIGGVGSALGVVGLWTGADHERTDPLGPFWMWKVA